MSPPTTRPLRSDSASSTASSTTPPDPGAAQFLQNLSQQQLEHLQYTIPAKHAPARFSVFLELPRSAPVPKRFTFDALNAASRKGIKAFAEGAQGKSKGHGVKIKREGESLPSTPSTPSTEAFLREVEKVKRVVEWDWRFYVTGLALVIINLVAALDATMLSIALPTITTALNGSALDAFWLGTASLAAATIFVPLYSICADIFGRRAMLLIALTCFAIGAFVGAVGSDFTALHIGRTIQGIGAGGLYTVSSIIITDLISEVDRKRWTAVLGATWAIGAISGPVIGGAFAGRGLWRWIFWLPLPLCGLAFLILSVFAQLKTSAPGSKVLKLWAFDWFGFVLFSASLISLLLGLTWGGMQHAWSSIPAFLPVVLGSTGLLLFIAWSWLALFKPIINLSRFLNVTEMSMFFSVFVQGIVSFAILYFVPLYFQITNLDMSLTQVGVWLFPWTLALSVIALITFFLLSKWPVWRVAAWVGWPLLMTGVALLTLFDRNTSTATWVGIAVVAGIGAGLLFPSLTIACAISTFRLPDEDLTAAVTNYTFFQTLGQTLGIAISSCLFQNTLRHQMVNRLLLDRVALDYARDAVALVATIRAMPGDNTGDDLDTRRQLQDAFLVSLRPVWYGMAVFAGVAFVLSLCMLFGKQKPQVKKSRQRAHLRILEAV